MPEGVLLCFDVTVKCEMLSNSIHDQNINNIVDFIGVKIAHTKTGRSYLHFIHFFLHQATKYSTRELIVSLLTAVRICYVSIRLS